MNEVGIRLEDLMTEGQRIEEIHKSLLKLTPPQYKWAVSTLIFELVRVVESKCEALQDLEQFGIHSKKDALEAYILMQHGNSTD